MLISQREYARQKGCSVQYVNKLVMEGRIVLTNGKIDPETADVGWNARMHQPRLEVEKAEPEKPAVAAVRETAVGSPNSYLQARTFHETYKAKTARLVYEQMQGKLVSSDEIMDKAMGAFSNCRVRMRGLARSLAPILVARQTPAEIEAILAEGIESALQSLSADVFK